VTEGATLGTTASVLSSALMIFSVPSPLQRGDVLRECVDPVGCDHFPASRTESVHVFLEKLPAPDRYVAVAVAGHDMAAVDHGKHTVVGEFATVPLAQQGKIGGRGYKRRSQRSVAHTALAVACGTGIQEFGLAIVHVLV